MAIFDVWSFARNCNGCEKNSDNEEDSAMKNISNSHIGFVAFFSNIIKMEF